ncbi:hypothetical protein [Loktanella salsilacus]|uniref:hypothetical protein n=1 Tax=Loktanella salsilacus TaxID=195913 RepID=UPI0037041275
MANKKPPARINLPDPIEHGECQGGKTAGSVTLTVNYTLGHQSYGRAVVLFGRLVSEGQHTLDGREHTCVHDSPAVIQQREPISLPCNASSVVITANRILHAFVSGQLQNLIHPVGQQRTIAHRSTLKKRHPVRRKLGADGHATLGNITNHIAIFDVECPPDHFGFRSLCSHKHTSGLVVGFPGYWENVAAVCYDGTAKQLLAHRH